MQNYHLFNTKTVLTYSKLFFIVYRYEKRTEKRLKKY